MVAEQAKETRSAENNNTEQEGPTGSAHAAAFETSFDGISRQRKSLRLPDPFALLIWASPATGIVYEQNRYEQSRGMPMVRRRQC
jgi:hypothetical protein